MYVKCFDSLMFRSCLVLVNTDVVVILLCKCFSSSLVCYMLVVVLSLPPDLRTYEFGFGVLPPMIVRGVDYNILSDSFTSALSST